MYGEIKFMNGIDPVGVKERELAIAEKRSHSAKIAHKRRKDKRGTLLQSQNDNEPRPSTVNTSVHKLNDAADKKLHPVEVPAPPQLPTPCSAPSSEQESTSEESQSPTSKSPEAINISCTQLSSISSVPRRPDSHLRLIFNNNSDWLQVFQFWINVPAPAIARYANPYGEVWTRIVPQFAMRSTTVRQMLLAHGYIYAIHYRAFSTDAHTFQARAYYHYSKGVKEMSTKTSGTEFLVAAKLGYCFEAIQEHYDRARLHLKGCEAIVSNYRGHKDETFQLLTASQDVAHTVTSILAHKAVKGCKNHPPQTRPWNCAPFDTTEGARHMIRAILEEIGDNLSPGDDAALGEIKTSLKYWADTVRKWDAQYAPSAKRSALHLLFNLAIALLPTNELGQLNQAASPHLIQYILKRTAEYLDNQKNMGVEDRKDLLTTLKMLANCIIRFVQLPEYQARSRFLLYRIEGSSDSPS